MGMVEGSQTGQLSRPRLQRATRTSQLLILSEPVSTSDELLGHSRYIRDFLAPMLDPNGHIPNSEVNLLLSVMDSLKKIKVTLALLRYSHIEKALLSISRDQNKTWPVDIVFKARNILRKWEMELGHDMTSVRADFFGIGGRLEGVEATSEGIMAKGEHDIDMMWSPTGLMSSDRASMTGHAGFEVGTWFLNPASACVAGMISTTVPPYVTVSSVEGFATAILLTRDQENVLGPSHNGDSIRYSPPPLHSNSSTSSRGRLSLETLVPPPRCQTHTHSSGLSNPVASLCRLLHSDADSVVRVLRSHNLKSVFAPKAGIRYDGLYRVMGYGVKFNSPSEWQYSFTLARLGSSEAVVGGVQEEQAQLEKKQTSLAKLRNVPTSDMMDDWMEYLQLCNEVVKGAEEKRLGDRKEKDAKGASFPSNPATEKASSKAFSEEQFNDSARPQSGDSGYHSATSRPKGIECLPSDIQDQPHATKINEDEATKSPPLASATAAKIENGHGNEGQGTIGGRRKNTNTSSDGIATGTGTAGVLNWWWKGKGKGGGKEKEKEKGKGKNPA